MKARSFRRWFIGTKILFRTTPPNTFLFLLSPSKITQMCPQLLNLASQNPLKPFQYFIALFLDINIMFSVPRERVSSLTASVPFVSH